MPWLPPSFEPPKPPKKTATRPSRTARGYGEHWQKLRPIVLAEEPFCRLCTEAGRVQFATCVDHIDGDVNNLDRTNLQPLCSPCHAAKTFKNLKEHGHG